jgi:hypothetical protein
VTVTFGKMGRVFLLVGVALLVIGLLGGYLLDGYGWGVAATTISGIGGILLVQGVAWTLAQRYTFGSIAELRRVAASGVSTTAQIMAVHSTSSQIGAEPIAKLDLMIGGQPATRRVRVPFNYATEIRPGRTLPVRIDPKGSRAMIVEWDRVG